MSYLLPQESGQLGAWSRGDVKPVLSRLPPASSAWPVWTPGKPVLVGPGWGPAPTLWLHLRAGVGHISCRS